MFPFNLIVNTSFVLFLIQICKLVNCQENNFKTYQYKPVVFWHGMGDTAYGSLSSLFNLIKNKLNNSVYVTSFQIGSNFEEDFINSYFGNVNKQLQEVCDLIKEDENLSRGFNLIGLSQGGQFSRALVQKCDLPKESSVYNLITLGAQHQGVFGLPKCPDKNYLCKYINELLDHYAYDDNIQNTIIQAQYWHDPINEKIFLEKSNFLADINNARHHKNIQYKENLLKLNNFVMIKFDNDTIVQPSESEHFGFFVSGQVQKIEHLEESDLFKQDWLGLKILQQENRLIKLNVPGNHLEIKKKWFIEEIINKYLKN